mgnify:CR=1 FL=1
MNDVSKEFLRFAIDSKVIQFGEFITKAGRRSPYFFNAGLFNDGQNLSRIANFFASTIINSGIEFDMLFGPAYKGITLASATAVALASKGKNVAFAYNRKEKKEHGEGGSLVGATMRGRVVIIDDVISAGTSIGESIEIIRMAGAEPVAVFVALDRMERIAEEGSLSANSAILEIKRMHGIPVIAVANLNDLFEMLDASSAPQEIAQYKSAVSLYRERYGVGTRTV